MRKHIIYWPHGSFLNFAYRQLLSKEWNGRIKAGQHPTLRSFAKEMGIPPATWIREFNRGKTSETVRNPNKPGRCIYGEYDPGKAQDEIPQNAENKGCPMIVTNILADKFTYYVKDLKLSPLTNYHRESIARGLSTLYFLKLLIIVNYVQGYQIFATIYTLTDDFLPPSLRAIPLFRIITEEQFVIPVRPEALQHVLLIIIQKESPVRTTHSASLREQPSGWWI